MTAEYRTEALAEARSKWRAARARWKTACQEAASHSHRECLDILAELDYWSNRLEFLDTDRTESVPEHLR